MSEESSSIHRIGVVGLGRLGRSLVASLEHALCDVLIYDKGRLTHPRCQSALLDVVEKSSIVFLTVQDDRLLSIAEEIHAFDVTSSEENQTKKQFAKTLVVCSGSFKLSQLNFLRESGWVCAKVHPLQTFSTRALEPFPMGTPFAIEAPDPVKRLLEDLVLRWYGQPHFLEEHQWFQYHLSAVMAANFLPLFIRHGIALLEPMAKDSQTAAEWIRPLVEESVRQALKMENLLPFSGPASRGDRVVMEEHLAWLEENLPELKTLYEESSKLIEAKYLDEKGD